MVRVDRTLPSGLGVPRPYGSDLLNRGRRSVAIDMKNPDGVATLLRLAEQADALIEPFRPGSPSASASGRTRALRATRSSSTGA